MEYINTNPRLLLILDDCASEFKIWFTKIAAFKHIFYEGRWKNMTTVIASQDDTAIDPKFRKNSMTTIMTHPRAAICMFDKPSNGFSKEEKFKGKQITEELFKYKLPNEKRHYRKLAIITEGNEMCFVQADIYNDFKMGSKVLWDLSDKIMEKKSSSLSENNMFISRLTRKASIKPPKIPEHSTPERGLRDIISPHDASAIKRLSHSVIPSHGSHW